MTSAKQLLDKDSVPLGKPELDLFSVPPTQVGVENSFFTEVLPQTTVTTEGPWTFCVPASQFMTDLSRQYLFMRLKITKADGTNLDAPAAGHLHDYCGPINLLGKVMFEQLKLYLNGKMVYDTADTYSYISYLTTVLQYGQEAKDNQLKVAGYEKDTPLAQIDTLAQNTGWAARALQYRESRLVELMAPLDFPLAQQERYLPSEIEVKVVLHRHKNDFILLSPDAGADFKIYIDDIRWLVRQVEVTPALEMTLRSGMQRQLAKYPVRRMQIRTLLINAGSQHTPSNNLWTGQLPRRIVIGMVSEQAFNGHYAQSPFNFKNFNLRRAWVVANGETYPKRGRPLRMDFTHNKYAQMYVQFYEALGLAGKDRGLDLGLDDLKQGHCLIVVDLRADTGVEDSSWETVRNGTTSVHLELGAVAPANGIRVICMAEFDNLMTIDGNRNVYSDFAL